MFKEFLLGKIKEAQEETPESVSDLSVITNLLPKEEKKYEIDSLHEKIIKADIKGREVAQKEKVAIIGPLMSLGNLGIPDAIGYAIGKNEGRNMKRNKEKMDSRSIAAALLVPGALGYRAGKTSGYHAKDKQKTASAKAKLANLGFGTKALGFAMRKPAIAGGVLGAGAGAATAGRDEYGRKKWLSGALVGGGLGLGAGAVGGRALTKAITNPTKPLLGATVGREASVAKSLTGLNERAMRGGGKGLSEDKVTALRSKLEQKFNARAAKGPAAGAGNPAPGGATSGAGAKVQNAAPSVNRVAYSTDPKKSPVHRMSMNEIKGAGEQGGLPPNYMPLHTTAKATKPMGYNAPVVSRGAVETGGTLGMKGTPMAVGNNFMMGANQPKQMGSKLGPSMGIKPQKTPAMPQTDFKPKAR